MPADAERAHLDVFEPEVPLADRDQVAVLQRAALVLEQRLVVDAGAVLALVGQDRLPPPRARPSLSLSHVVNASAVH